MPDTPGMGTVSTTIHRQNRKRLEGEQSVSGLPVSNHQSSTPKFSGIVANAISRIPVDPRIQDLYLASSKEGLPSIVAPESSVILGRSITSYHRGGWLELQERLPEEIAVAAIWLAGVDKLRAVFEWGKKKILPSYDHISTNTAWDRTWGKVTHVDLSPQEMFTNNSREIDTLLKLKSVRWLFSVGLALTSVAYLIPKANQMKTDMILRRLNRRKRQTEGSNVQFGDPTPQTQPAPQRRTSSLPSMASPLTRTLQPLATGFTQGPSPFLSRPSTTQPFSIGNTFAANSQSPYATPSTRQSFQSTAPYSSYPHPIQPQFQGGNHSTHPARQGKGVQFGGIPGSSLIQGLGHLVEQTPYGSILVVDAGIAGGRGYVASKRSPYETVEVLFRDLGSLYFYILCAPHLMKGMGWLLNKPFGTSIGIQPRVAEQIHEAIKKKFPTQPITAGMVEKVIKGATGELGDLLMTPEGDLKMAMRHASSNHFLELLQKEAQVYLKDSKNQSLFTTEADIRELLGTHLPAKGQSLDPQQIHKLLNAIENRHDQFNQLTDADRRNLGIAVKQAFRHTVGMSFPLDKIAQQDVFKNLYTTLNHPNSQEADELTQRIRKIAHIDNLNQTHSMLRRGINVMHGKSELLTRGDALASWIDEAVNRHMTLPELIEHEIKQAKTGNKTFHMPEAFKKKLETLLGEDEVSRFESLSGHPLSDGAEAVSDAVLHRIHTTMKELADKAVPNSAEHGLLEHYTHAVANLIQGNQGRLFSLAIEQHDAGLSSKLREMLKGGLENDSRFLHQALDIVGQLETDSRKFASTAKADRMRGIISNYTDALLQKANQPLLKSTLRDELEKFYTLNRNLHYGAWTIAMGVTMTCLGWLVPHLQTLLTKRLTGKDIHPGIASAEHAQEVSRNAKISHATGHSATQPTPYFNSSVANRNQYAGTAYYRPRPPLPYQGA